MFVVAEAEYASICDIFVQMTRSIKVIVLMNRISGSSTSVAGGGWFVHERRDEDLDV